MSPALFLRIAWTIVLPVFPLILKSRRRLPGSLLFLAVRAEDAALRLATPLMST